MRRPSKKTAWICLCSLLWLTGCVGQASLKKMAPQNGKVVVDDIVQNQEDYTIFFISVHGNTGNTALLFNRKDDGRKLEANTWTPVESAAALDGHLQMMQRRGYTHFFEIRGADDQLFGYMLAARSHIAARQVGENTLEVYPFRQQATGP